MEASFFVLPFPPLPFLPSRCMSRQLTGLPLGGGRRRPSTRGLWRRTWTRRRATSRRCTGGRPTRPRRRRRRTRSTRRRASTRSRRCRCRPRRELRARSLSRLPQYGAAAAGADGGRRSAGGGGGREARRRGGHGKTGLLPQRLTAATAAAAAYSFAYSLRGGIFLDSGLGGGWDGMGCGEGGSATRQLLQRLSSSSRERRRRLRGLPRARSFFECIILIVHVRANK